MSIALSWIIIFAAAIALVVAWVVTLLQEKREANSKPAESKAD